MYQPLSLWRTDFRKKLSSIREDMKSENSLRETKDPALQIVDTFYHQIERYPVAGNLLIFASVYQSLQKDTQKLFYVQCRSCALIRSPC